MDDIISDDDLLARFAGYPVNRDSAAHYRGWLERRLLINRCQTCGTWHHTPKPICPACWSTDVIPTEVSGAGALFMTIFLHQGPPAEGVDYSTPYPVVTVALDEPDGVRFTSTVVDATNDEIRIGARVELDWIDRAGAPLPVFRLAEAAR